MSFWEAFSGKRFVCCACRSIVYIYVRPWQHINSVCVCVRVCVRVCVLFMKPVMPEMATTKLYNALSSEGWMSVHMCMCVCVAVVYLTLVFL